MIIRVVVLEEFGEPFGPGELLFRSCCEVSRCTLRNNGGKLTIIRLNGLDLSIRKCIPGTSCTQFEEA